MIRMNVNNDKNVNDASYKMNECTIAITYIPMYIRLKTAQRNENIQIY